MVKICFTINDMLKILNFNIVENVLVKIIYFIKIKNDIWNRQKDRVCVCVIEHFKITKISFVVKKI